MQQDSRITNGPVSPVSALTWRPDQHAVDIIDQRKLPQEEVTLKLGTAAEIADAIRSMAIRGAPAIGIAAAFAVALESRRDHFDLDRTIDLLAQTRPTAVNLFWALERMRVAANEGKDLFAEAIAILEEDQAMCRAIGENGAPLLPPNARVLTHCNAGALATGGMGTALAPIYIAHEKGMKLKVFADETRPLLQGSRLTAWELGKAGVDVTLVPDVVAATLMKQKKIDLVIVGADRIAANGDVANKIGTYGVAILAKHHGIPFYVAAPSSTIDMQTKTGDDIEIEERDADEVRKGFGTLTAPADVNVYSPAFDVTPAELITAIITDRGVLRPNQLEG